MVTANKEEAMPAKLFFELNPDKQMKIIHTGISEFAAYGYTNSSTNRIVKNSGISKGSLFKYFTNKEDFFFFILDTVTAELTESLTKEAANLSRELFQRVIEYAALEFTWYIQNPEKSQLILRAFSKNETAVYQKVLARYGSKEQDIYYELLKDINTVPFQWDMKMTLDILKWFLKGFNEEFMETVQIKTAQIKTAQIKTTQIKTAQTETVPPQTHSFEQLKSDYVKNLTAYMGLLKSGL